MFKTLTALFCLFLSGSIIAQQKAEQFNISLNYLLYTPPDYANDTTRKWPLLVFLHGSGERGNDIEKVKLHGPPKLIQQGKHFPFIVVSPQAPPNEGWEPQIVARLVKDLKSRYRVDGDRIYLTGLSMGGFGAWSTAAKFPQLFAAIAPVCGGGDTSTVKALKNVAVWCFHGAKDKVVLPDESYRMVNALKKFNPDVKLTIYPEAEHDSWTATYNNDSLYTWLLQQKRFRFLRTSLSEKQLQEYAGGYAEKGKDTFHLILSDGKLMVKEEPAIQLSPSSGDTFFFTMDDSDVEMRFTRDKKGKVEKLLMFQDERTISFYKAK